MKSLKPLIMFNLILVMMCGSCTRETAKTTPQEWPFELQKVWEIQQIGGDQLLRPAEPRIADDGTLYLHDFERHLSYIIDGDGNPVGTFAPRGSDEGEVPMYMNCFPAADNVAVCALDKIHFFTKKGQFVKAVPNNLFIRFPLAFKNENEFWVAPGALGDSPGDSAVVTYVNLAKGEETTAYRFARSEIEKMPTGGAVIIGLTPQIKMGFDQLTNMAYFGKNSDTVIYRVGADGGKVESFSFAGIRRKVSEEDKRKHFAKFDIPKDVVASMIKALPGQMAYYNRIQVANGLVYLFSNESIGGALTGQDINIYSPDGQHLYHGRIQVEDGWHISNPDNLQLGHGFIYAILENDDGIRKVVKYKIALPQS